MQPKSKGIGLMIAFGKPKDSPPPLKRMDAEDEPPAKQPERAPSEMDMRHERGEETMNFGDIGAKFGLDPESATAFAHDVLEACMKMTGGAKHEQQEPPEAEESGEGETEEYPA